MEVDVLPNSHAFDNRGVYESLFYLNPEWQQNVNNELLALLYVTLNFLGFSNRHQNSMWNSLLLMGNPAHISQI
jgi:hypothetical protein